MWSHAWLPSLPQLAAWEDLLRDPEAWLPSEHSTVRPAGTDATASTAAVGPTCSTGTNEDCATPAAAALPFCTSPIRQHRLPTLWHSCGVTCALPSNLLCSHLPLQAPNAPLCLLHLPRSRQTRCLQLRKLLLQAKRPLSRSVQLAPQVPHLQPWMKYCGRQGGCGSAVQQVAGTWCCPDVK